MDEITRTEKFLRACIDGEPCALKPLTRVEKLLAELNETLAGGPSEVVILPETEMAVDAEAGQAPITTPLSATPTEGATANVTYNGTEYPCTVARFEEDGLNCYALGNLDEMGLSGGNPDAPFVVSLIPDGMDGVYGIVMTMEEVTSITLSIVQVGAASGGESDGGVFVVNVTIDSDTEEKPNVTACDKTVAEVDAAINAGKICMAVVSGPYESFHLMLATDNYRVGAMGHVSRIVFAANVLDIDGLYVRRLALWMYANDDTEFINQYNHT